ncbi:MAG: ATP-dependent helicase [Candidatus Hodarchaeales archaeon]|jgi:DNA helicase-2/ATP-dependent DNA helicase PcrA
MLEEVFNIFPGPILVLAGPGTGKTHNMALRVKWLVEERGVKPEEITVITFTAEAAINMRHRLSDEEKKDVFMPRDMQPNEIRTMHSLSLKIIVSNLDLTNLNEDFTILSSKNIRRLLFEDAAQLTGFPREKGNEALYCKERGIIPEKDNDLRAISDKYVDIMTASNSIDFDDQIIIACDLLKKNKSILSEYQKKATYLLIDEYQDINYYQYCLIRLLCGDHLEGLFAVGDDDQSIYSFRGGSPAFIRNFERDFGDNAKIVNINLCRRCPPSILNSALAIVERYNPDRIPKDNPSFLKESEVPVKIINNPSEIKEADYIANICSKVVPSHDVLILLPDLNYAKPITMALQRKRISYSCDPYFNEKGINVLEAFGNWLSNQDSNIYLRECIQFLLEGTNFKIPSRKARKAEKIEEREKILAIVSNLWVDVIKGKNSLYESLKLNASDIELFSKLVVALDRLKYLYENDDENFLGEIGEILNPWPKPKDMFREISKSIEEIGFKSGAGKSLVRIMSMRMAKGLEADFIFVVGLDENVFPRPNLPKEKFEEASRLMFVSMSRAKMALYLCRSRKRSAAITYLSKSFGLKDSCFIKVLPKEYHEVKYIKT